MDDHDVARCWDDNAETWANDVRKGYDTYRDLFHNPAFLAFVGELTGREVLDLGCGEGYTTRLFAAQGARVTGVDISAEMIRLARAAEQERPLGISYEVASASDLSRFAEAHFDAVLSTMAMMDLPDYPGAVGAVARVLKRGGVFAFSINHPCLGYGRVRFEQSADEVRPVVIGEYFSEEPTVETWRFRGTPAGTPGRPYTVPRFPRPLSAYLNPLAEHGLHLVALEEPRPNEETCQKEPRLRKWQRLPAFLFVKAVKRVP